MVQVHYPRLLRNSQTTMASNYYVVYYSRFVDTNVSSQLTSLVEVDWRGEILYGDSRFFCCKIMDYQMGFLMGYLGHMLGHARLVSQEEMNLIVRRALNQQEFVDEGFEETEDMLIRHLRDIHDLLLMNTVSQQGNHGVAAFHHDFSTNSARRWDSYAR